MSDCCLPNLGCLAIPILSTNVNGPAGQNGVNGVSVLNAFYNTADGTLTLNYSNNTSQNVGVVRGGPGLQGGPGVDGVARLHYDTTYETESVSLGWTPKYSYSILPNALVYNGDALVINLVSMNLIQQTGIPDIYKALRRIRFVTGAGVPYSMTLLNGGEVDMRTASLSKQYNTRVEIIKTSSTTALCKVSSDQNIGDITIGSIGYQQYNYQVLLTGLNFSTVNYIYADMSQAVINQVSFNSITIDKISIG